MRVKKAAFGIPGRAAHHISFPRVHSQGQRGQAVGNQVDPEDLDRYQGQRPAQKDGGKDGDNLSGVAGKKEENRFFDIFIDHPSLFDGSHNGGKIIVRENNLRRLFGHGGACPAHGRADVGLFQSRRVVDSIAGHSRDLSVSLQRLDDAHLLFRRYPGKYFKTADLASQLLVVELF